MDVLNSALSKATISSYQHHWNALLQFHFVYKFPLLMPVPQHIVAMFLVYLKNRGLKASTIRTYLTAISFVHKIKQLQDPTTGFLINKTMQGISNLDKLSPNPSRKPITKELLHRMIDAVPFTQNNQYSIILVRALFLLSYHACMRAGEAVTSTHDQHTLLLQDVQKVVHEGHPAYQIAFTSYKHSKGGSSFILTAARQLNYCPVKALGDYLLLRGSTPGKLFVNISGQPLDRQYFNNAINMALLHLGMPAWEYNTHSFRIGRATQLALENAPDNTIRSVGRWHSNAYRTYIKPQAMPLPN